MTVPFDELAGSPRYQATRQGAQVTETLLVAWSNIDAFLAERLPDPTYVGFNLNLPTSYLGRGIYFLEEVGIEPFFPDEQLGDGTYPSFYPSAVSAKCTMTYRTAPYTTGGKQNDNQNKGGDPSGPMINFKVSIGAEAEKLGDGAVQWALTNKASKTNDTTGLDSMVVRPMIQHGLTFLKTPAPPWNAIRNSIGKVNVATFAGANRACLLFLGCEGHRDFTPQGLQSWSLDYKFTEKDWGIDTSLNTSDFPSGVTIGGQTFRSTDHIGWLHAYRSSTKRYEILLRSNGDPIYLFQDFNPLFRPEL